jgi:RNA-splicing ligase RtcB
MAVPADIKRISDTIWEFVSHKPGMRVPAYMPQEAEAMDDGVFERVIMSPLCLASCATPTACRTATGYGFPFGGVERWTPSGMVSPGGIGFDIAAACAWW